MLLETDSSSAEILVALEAAIVPAIAVTAFLPLLDGILIASAVVFFWVFLPPADVEVGVADEAGGSFLAVHVGREFLPEVEGAI